MNGSGAGTLVDSRVSSWLDDFRQEARECSEAGDWSRVIACCNVVYGAEESDLDNLLLLGRAYQAKGELELAGAVFQEMLRSNPSHPEAHRELAIVKRITEPAKSFCSIPQDQERIACPFCAGSQSQRVRASADIVECFDCKTVYLRTRMTVPAMEKLYQSYADEGTHMGLPSTPEEASRSSLRREAFLKEILQHTAPEGEFLDIGCGWGAFLLGARDHGFTVSGLELTRRAAQYGEEILRIPIQTSQFLDTSYGDNKFQVVTMNHVLEHLPHPKEALEKIFRILRPGGLFCGIVPNFGSYCSELLQDQWYWLDPNYHYVHYRTTTLRERLTAAGFSVQKLYTATGDYRRERVIACAREFGHSLPTAEGAETFIRGIEASGQGEEIRFFARKPAMG